jgi:hypothetical protein
MMMRMMIICGTYRGSTDANCQDTPTQHMFSTVPHTATNLQNSLQSNTKQIKTTIARNLKER